MARALVPEVVVRRHVCTQSQGRSLEAVSLVLSPVGQRRLGAARRQSIVQARGRDMECVDAVVEVANRLGLTQSQGKPLGLVTHVRARLGQRSLRVAHLRSIASVLGLSGGLAH